MKISIKKTKKNIVENTTIHVFVIQGKRTEVFFETWTPSSLKSFIGCTKMFYISGFSYIVGFWSIWLPCIRFPILLFVRSQYRTTCLWSLAQLPLQKNRSFCNGFIRCKLQRNPLLILFCNGICNGHNPLETSRFKFGLQRIIHCKW